jgi:hypothetical protein
MDGLTLELGLPDGPVPWWEIRTEFEDGDAPWPPPAWPADVLAVQSARMTIVRVPAACGSAALARVEGLFPLSLRCQWTVRMLTAGDVLTGL